MVSTHGVGAAGKEGGHCPPAPSSENWLRLLIPGNLLSEQPLLSKVVSVALRCFPRCGPPQSEQVIGCPVKCSCIWPTFI